MGGGSKGWIGGGLRVVIPGCGCEGWGWGSSGGGGGDLGVKIQEWCG